MTFIWPWAGCGGSFSVFFLDQCVRFIVELLKRMEFKKQHEITVIYPYSEVAATSMWLTVFYFCVFYFSLQS